MFKDKSFNISFLVSLLGHLFCIYMFCVVVTPIGLSYNTFPTISFLGPILEEGSFRDAVDIKPSSIPTPHRKDFTAVSRVDIQGFNSDLTRMAWASAQNDSFDKTNLGRPSIEKKTPVYKTRQLSGLNKKARAQKRPGSRYFKITGGFKEADIKNAPDMPLLPEWAKKSSQDFSIVLKVGVSGEGIVQEVERMTTTGYPKLDAIAMRYARELVFNPVSGRQARKGRIEVFLKGL